MYKNVIQSYAKLMTHQTLYLMLGIPGAGKTTASKIIADATGASHIWADQVRRTIHTVPSYTQSENDELYAKLNKTADKLLGQGESVIFDTAFNHYEDRQKLQAIADKHGANTLVVWVKASSELAKQRAQNSHNHIHTRLLGDMTDEHFLALRDKLEEPKDTEKTLILDGTKLSKAYVLKSLNQAQ
jgi:predicted kinase